MEETPPTPYSKLVDRLRDSTVYFVKNFARLLRNYPNQYVAISGNAVVDSHPNAGELDRRLNEGSYRNIALLVERVSQERLEHLRNSLANKGPVVFSE